MRPPSPLFFALLGLTLLAGCAGYAALVLYSTTWQAARTLDPIFPFYPWHTKLFSASAFYALRNGLALLSTGLALGTAGIAFLAKGRLELRLLRTEATQTWQKLRASLRQLSPTERRWAGGLLLALTLLRLYFSLTNPEYDDAVSYEVFVSKGLFATTAYYPIPNNHIFSNTVSWLFYQVSPGFWWSMRLPVLLISTAATVLWFAGLARCIGFRAATVATTAFSWLQLSLYHAGVGRGYWLIIGLAGIVFFCTLSLAEGKQPPRAAWLGLTLAGVLGCFTVPTFAYVLTSACSWLGLCSLRHRQWAQLLRLGVVGSLMVAGAVLLYAPLLLVSGFDKLVGNGYVAALSSSVFWAGFPGYIWHNEGFLAGQRTLGAFITLLVLGLVGVVVQQARAGKLPVVQTARWRRIGIPALWFMLLPYLVIAIQHVFPPERVMLYKAFFFFTLVGLVIDWLLVRWPGARGLPRALAMLAVLFGLYETYAVVRVNPAARGTNGAYHAGLRWLAAQPAGPVLIPEPTHNLFFRFYAHTEARQRTWQFDNLQQPNTRYAYVVAFPNDRGFFRPRFGFAPAYHNEQVDIYVVPQGYPLAANAWRH